MALEHNLIYFTTRAKAATAVSVEEPAQKTAAFPVSVITSIVDVRKKADELGLSLPVLLRRMHDPDKIHDIAPDNTYNFITEEVNTDRTKDQLNKAKESNVSELIPTDYYAVIYSSYVRHVEEMNSVLLNKITGFGG